MLQNVSFTPSRRALEFGIYRDGDNNLDSIQESTLSQALQTSARDARIEFTVEDTTKLRSDGDSISSGPLHTEQYTIAGGDVAQVHVSEAHEMSDEANLARFVARTLDNAQASGAKQTWIDLVDHGGGDGGGLQTAGGKCMSMPDIAKAIADGVALHAAAHPEDAGRGDRRRRCESVPDGYDGLRRRALARRGEVSRRQPRDDARARSSEQRGACDRRARERPERNGPQRRRRRHAHEVRRRRFRRLRPRSGLRRARLEPGEDPLGGRGDQAPQRRRRRTGAQSRGSQRDSRRRARNPTAWCVSPAAREMPWHADRPAIAFYDTLAERRALGSGSSPDAAAASAAVRSLVLAHRESDDFGRSAAPTTVTPSGRPCTFQHRALKSIRGHRAASPRRTMPSTPRSTRRR